MHRHRRQKAAADGRGQHHRHQEARRAVRQQPGFCPVSARSPARGRRPSRHRSVLTRVRFAVACLCSVRPMVQECSCRRKDARRVQLAAIQESGDFPIAYCRTCEATSPTAVSEPAISAFCQKPIQKQTIIWSSPCRHWSQTMGLTVRHSLWPIADKLFRMAVQKLYHLHLPAPARCSFQRPQTAPLSLWSS